MDTAPSAWDRGKSVWALLLGSSLVYFFSINEADNDLWGHVLFGRHILAHAAIARVDAYSYTAAGHPWWNHEWLSQVLLAAVYQWAGSPGLLLMKLAAAVVTFLLLLSLMRRCTSIPYVWGGVGLLTIAVLARGFAIRPQILTYFGVALTLWLLDRYEVGHRRALWLFPALFLVWGNLHGGFVLGLAILGLFACADLLRGTARSAQPWIALIASTAATALNPYGPRLLLYVWNELSRAHPITEWQSAAPTDVAQFVFFATLALFVGTLPFLRGWREQGWRVLLAVGIGFLAVRHQRHTPVFAVCAAAPLAAQLEEVRRWLAQKSSFSLSPVSHRLIAYALVGLALLQIAFAGLRCRRDGLRIVFDPRDYPTAAVRALQRGGTSVNLAVPLDWGQYVLWFLTPQVKVSLDGRFATVFPERVVQDNFDFFSAAPGWRRLVDEYPTEAALVPVESPCPIRHQPGWLRVYGDAVAEVYVRADKAEALQLGPAPAARVAGIFP